MIEKKLGQHSTLKVNLFFNYSVGYLHCINIIYHYVKADRSVYLGFRSAVES